MSRRLHELRKNGESKDASSLAHCRAIAGGTIEAFRRKTQEIKANRNLSIEGHKSEIQAASKNPLEFFGELKRQAASDRAKLDARREHFQLKPPSRDDFVGAIERWEIRDNLQRLPPGERRRQALMDPTIAAAVLANQPL
jgi:hypothetical protein